MQLVFDFRASSILYLFLLENKGKGKWMIQQMFVILFQLVL